MIDITQWPFRVLFIRGIDEVDTVDGVISEYATATERYISEEQDRAWMEQERRMSAYMARIATRPMEVTSWTSRRVLRMPLMLP